jgi:hypothetical protein
VNARYGRQTLRSGATLAASETPAMPRDDLPARRGAVLPGETRRQRLAIPRMTVVV